MRTKQSVGQCNLCGKIVGRAAMARHLEACCQSEVSGRLPVSGKCTLAPAFHLVIEGRYANAYWLHLAVSKTVPLSKLDSFLRRTWLECCGHMSAFEIGAEHYISAPMEQELRMTARLDQVVEVGTKFSYRYDFGSTTDLVLKVLSFHERLMPKSGVWLLARNEAPEVRCSQCGARRATQICTECQWNGGGWFCDDCARAHDCGDEMCLPVVNSPRAGMCGYTG